jgi:AraC-like DNA-binding protein
MKLPPWRLRWLTEYANDRLDRAISTAEIASEIGISVGHLHRAFRLTTGQTLLTFVNEQRIQRAQQLLVSRTLRSEILLCRFSQSEPFCQDLSTSRRLEPGGIPPDSLTFLAILP